jgi:hypothetical protein
MSDVSVSRSRDKTATNLYIVGGVAAFLTIAMYIVEVFTFGGIPTEISAWFELFGRSRLLGLFYLNSLDILSISILLAFYAALRRAADNSLSEIAAPFAYLGIGVFVTIRSTIAIGVLNLSERYAAAPTEAAREPFLAAGEAISSLGQATPLSPGFFFIALASLLLSLALLRMKSAKAAAITGIAFWALAGIFLSNLGKRESAAT